MQLKTILLTSTTLVRVSGWSWYSIPMLKLLMKMQRRIPCWKIVWSTIKFKQALIRPKKLLTAEIQADMHLKRSKKMNLYCMSIFINTWTLASFLLELSHWGRCIDGRFLSAFSYPFLKLKMSNMFVWLWLYLQPGCMLSSIYTSWSQKPVVMSETLTVSWIRPAVPGLKCPAFYLAFCRRWLTWQERDGWLQGLVPFGVPFRLRVELIGNSSVCVIFSIMWIFLSRLLLRHIPSSSRSTFMSSSPKDYDKPCNCILFI